VTAPLPKSARLVVQPLRTGQDQSPALAAKASTGAISLRQALTDIESQTQAGSPLKKHGPPGSGIPTDHAPGKVSHSSHATSCREAFAPGTNDLGTVALPHFSPLETRPTIRASPAIRIARSASGNLGVPQTLPWGPSVRPRCCGCSFLSASRHVAWNAWWASLSKFGVHCAANDSQICLSQSSAWS